MNCPICSEKMKFENNTFICHHCGYIIHEKTKNTSDTLHFDYKREHQPATPQKRKLFRNFHMQLSQIIFLSCIITAILHGIFKVILLKPDFNPQPDTTATILNKEDNTSSNHINATNPAPFNYQILPKSAFFIQFAEQVFQKDISNIHPEELAHITSIRIYRNENQIKTVAYTIDDSKEGMVLFSTIPNYDYADLSCFTGLKILNIEDGSGIIRKGDLNGLVNLTEIRSDKTPSELVSILPAPEKLNTLAINDSFFLKSFEGIEHFKNLTTLLIDGGSLKTLAGLELLPSLKKLELLDSNQIEDFSALYKTSGLEFLSIESSALRDIGFIENMPNLNSLSIKDANVLQIQALSSCATSLQNLSLWHTYKVEDYRVLNTLNNLTYLQIELPYNYPAISFAHMKELKALSLGRVSDIRSIATALHLQTLELEGCNGEYLSALTGLSELKSLKISNLSGYLITLEPLKQLTSLEQLILKDCRIYANIEGVFSLPELKEFTLENCSIGFDFNNLPENSSLEKLKLKNTIFAKILPQGDSEYAQIKKENAWKLSDYSETLEKFPNLIELSLVGNELDNINFATKLKKLQKLDITNNYVTDLTPLSQLTELQTILCPNNPIVYTNGVNAEIIR